MSIQKIQCPHCRSVLEIEEEWNGEETLCPSCNQSFIAALNLEKKSNEKKTGGINTFFMHLLKIVTFNCIVIGFICCLVIGFVYCIGAYQKDVEKKLLEGLKNKKENDIHLFYMTGKFYIIQIGNKRLKNIKTLQEILKTSFNFNLPSASQMSETFMQDIITEAEKQLSGTVDQYTKARKSYYEKLYPLAKEGDTIIIHTYRYGTITGVFYGLSGYSQNIISIGPYKFDMLDVDEDSILKIDNIERQQFINEKVDEDRLKYITLLQNKINELKFKRLLKEGYFYYQNKFYSPNELYEYFFQSQFINDHETIFL